MSSELKVDTISEKTSANGVTIDGALIKDSKLSASAGGGLVLLDSHDFSSATSVTRDNVFSSNYKTYLWELVIDSNSAVGYTDFNYRSGGTTYTTGTYDYQFHWTALGSSSASVNNGQDQTKARVIYNGSTGGSLWTMTMSNIGISNLYDMAVGHGTIWDFGTSYLQENFTWRTGTNSAYDGFVLTPSSGNITGTVKTYGKA